MRYEYTIHREAYDQSEVLPPEFSWHFGPWSKCTVTCGSGEKRGGHSCGPAAGLTELLGRASTHVATYGPHPRT